MKSKKNIPLLSLALLVLLCNSLFAQKETFDISTYASPKGWKKETSASAVQFSKEDAAKGSYCMITLLKALPGTANSKDNFDAAWESVVKEMVKITTPPTMQAPAKEDGWEAQSGYSPFELDGNKGIAMLITSSGYDQMVNIVVLTNTDAYENEMSAFLESVSFKKPAGNNTQKPTTAPTTKTTNTPTVAKKDGFAFTTTNFDDGWTSTVQEDWVATVKGNIKVLIHYPNKKADAYNSVLKDEDYTAWNILVSTRYSNMKNFEWKSIQSWESITFIRADATENATGKNVHIVLFKKHYSNGSGKYLEFVSESKAAYEREFGAYQQESYGWERVEKMVTYNRFAVAAADLKGKWTNNFTGLTQYVNANTGASAGADTHSSNQVFEFLNGSAYKWSISMASGFVGNIKFQGAKAAGKYSVPNNWQITFSDIEGKPKKYNAYFSCIKGARILWLQDTGYGDYTGYGKSE
jgi:hypothetical protein